MEIRDYLFCLSFWCYKILNNCSVPIVAQDFILSTPGGIHYDFLSLAFLIWEQTFI